MLIEHEDLTGEIIGAFYSVYRTLGCGSLEKVYENALGFEFEARELVFGKQVEFDILYMDKVAGKYIADFIVDGKVVVEVKAKGCLDGGDEMQLINYLRGTRLKVGLLVNFGGKKLEFKRMVLGVQN